MLIEHPRSLIDEHLKIYNQTPPFQRWRQMTLNELLLENRCIFLDLPLAPDILTNQGTVSSVVIKSLLYLDNLKRGSDIHMYINCPGGSIDDTMAVYDTIQFISSDVCTYCIGHAASGGAVILAAGTKGKRYALPHAKVMIHQPTGGVTGQAADIQIQAEEILRMKTMINEILAKHTGQPIEKITAETERDRWMSADEARQYGIIDEVLHEEEDKKKQEDQSNK